MTPPVSRKLFSAKRVFLGCLLFAFVPSLLPAADLIVAKYASTDSVAFVIGILALGVLFGLLCYTLFLAISTKEPLFLYFCIIMALLAILQTFSTYDRFFFHLTYNRVTLVTHTLFITFLLFFEQLFAIAEHDRRLSSFNKTSILVIAGYTILFLVLKQIFASPVLHALLNFIRELFVFYTNALFLYTIIRSRKWMHKEALLLLIAFIPPAFVTSVNALSIFPFMRSHQAFSQFLMQYNQPIGLSLQAILFSLATANRYNHLRDEEQASKQKQEELERITNARTQFFLSMSHETRTPLTIILGLVRQLRQGSYGPSLKSADAVLQAIERNSLTLLRLVNQLLRLEHTPSPKIAKPLALLATIRLIISEFEPIAHERGLALSLEEGRFGLPPALLVGQDDFESLLMNLLSNALKYTRSGGTITVKVFPNEQGGLLLSVVDTGIGIPNEEQSRIFEQFAIIADEKVSLQTGLGLPLVRHIMRGYGGEVLLESCEGKGSTFTLVFPPSLVEVLHAEDQSSSATLAPLFLSDFSHLHVDAQDGATDLPTVLVVEDHADLRWYIHSILAQHYRVLLAEDASEGLALLKDEHVDLIICDVMMPRMDGHAFLKEVKIRFREAPIPLIFLTARDSVEEKIDSLREGAIRYLTKPFRPEVLLAIIESVLSHDKELLGSRIEHVRNGLAAVLEEMENPERKSDSFAVRQFARQKELSHRETEVLLLIAKGLSDKEIGAQLSLSPKTVANHNRAIYTKCEVSGRYELLSKLYGSS
ncbi:response regulator [Sphaerochaeta sp.]|uniref:response regulator n=1 Tax=Sphaerochaeta sp. TaxID=1972642 RepID=UPI003D12D5F9